MLLSRTTIKAWGTQVLCQSITSLPQRLYWQSISLPRGRDFINQEVSHFYFSPLSPTFQESRQPQVRTRAEGPVAVPAELCHHSHSVGSRLPNLRAAVTHRLQHGPQEVLGVLEGGGAAVLHDIVKDAQPPLPVWPRPMRTLRHQHTTVRTPWNYCTANDYTNNNHGNSGLILLLKSSWIKFNPKTMQFAVVIVPAIPRTKQNPGGYLCTSISHSVTYISFNFSPWVCNTFLALLLKFILEILDSLKEIKFVWTVMCVNDPRSCNTF